MTIQALTAAIARLVPDEFIEKDIRGDVMKDNSKLRTALLTLCLEFAEGELEQVAQKVIATHETNVAMQYINEAQKTLRAALPKEETP